MKLTYEKVEPGVYKIKTDALKPATEYGFVPVGQAAKGESIVFLFGTN
ncbi:MAG: hypothetical protein NTY88_03565 [Bacteroidetes bacterium]|nr:hypothetical protein [Bacteroidota bacterium]